MYKSLFALKRSYAYMRALEQNVNKGVITLQLQEQKKKRVISIFKLILWNFKILSLILLHRAKKASFLQHCAGCWGWGGGAQLVVHTEHRPHARIQEGGGAEEFAEPPGISRHI